MRLDRDIQAGLFQGREQTRLPVHQPLVVAERRRNEFIAVILRSDVDRFGWFPRKFAMRRRNLKFRQRLDLHFGKSRSAFLCVQSQALGHGRTKRDETIDMAEFVARLIVGFKYAGTGAVIETDDLAALRRHRLRKDTMQRKPHGAGPEFRWQVLALAQDMLPMKIDPLGQSLIGRPGDLRIE